MNKIEWNSKPNIVYFAYTAFFKLIIVLLIVGYFLLPIMLFKSHFINILGVIIYVLMIIGYIIYEYYVWKTYKYYATKDGIYIEGGILLKIKKFTPYYKITNFTTMQGILQQLLDIKTIAIYTAGFGARYPELNIWGIPSKDADNLENLLYKKVDKLKKAISE